MSASISELQGGCCPRRKRQQAGAYPISNELSYIMPGKFCARRGKNNRGFILVNIYKHLRQDVFCRSLGTWIVELLHATETLHRFDSRFLVTTDKSRRLKLTTRFGPKRTPRF